MKLTPLTEATREAQALEAYRLMESGASVLEACNEAGISTRQYYRWIARSSNAIEQIKQMISDQERTIIGEIASARIEALRKLSAAIYTENNTSKLMAIEAHLRAVQNDIQDRHGFTSMDRSANDFLLKGPSTEQQESRTSISIVPSGKGVTLNISSPEVINLSEEDDDNG